MRKKFKYIVDYGNFVNCPSCDGSYGSQLEFYNSLKEMMGVALTHMHDREYKRVYTTSGRLVAEFGYNYGKHRVNQLLFQLEAPKKRAWRTMDDGHGELLWSKKDL